MRYALMLLWMIGFSCLVLAPGEPPAKAQVVHTKTPEAAAGEPPPDSFQVIGPFQTSREDAWQSAVVKARDEVIGRLRAEGVIEWQPTTDYVSARLIQQRKEELENLPDPVGVMRRYVVEVKITPEAKAEMIRFNREAKSEKLRFDREARGRERMTGVGIVLAAIVALLGAVAGYLRLDELTKGFYTGWLLAAAGLVGALAAAGIAFYWFMAA